MRKKAVKKPPVKKAVKMEVCDFAKAERLKEELVFVKRLIGVSQEKEMEHLYEHSILCKELKELETQLFAAKKAKKRTESRV